MGSTIQARSTWLAWAAAILLAAAAAAQDAVPQESDPAVPDSGVADAPQQVPAAQRQRLQARARQRAAQDAKRYSRAQLQEAEELYQVANRNWRSPEAKQSLEAMVKKFPNINRTGCAVLYLAQYSEGEEQERLLKQAVQKHSDCFYLNGVQVGAYARLLLGGYYQQNGEPDKAKPLFDEIRKRYPDSITHRGESIVAKLPKQ